jgi:eukaryotic-like serine/threonine-protein kinase
MATNEFPDFVIDEAGNIHYLILPPIGRGGQGIVVRTRNPHIAVKLLGGATTLERGADPRRANASQGLWDGLNDTAAPAVHDSPQARAALRERLEDVRVLPLRGLHLAQPLSMLREYPGYTMELLTDMVPMRSLITPPATPKPAAFYRETGGLRRRLELLSKAAALLARLHDEPLVYADISPNNLFVSGETGSSEVWLIDLDNLDYPGSRNAAVFTPGFGAPEVVTGRAGVTTLSDAYAFSVLAFYVLAQVHPFLGDYVEEGGWEDEDREALAFSGELPWIEDPDDDSNATSQGIPRAFVLSRPLRDCFHRTFGPGRKDRMQRPGLAEWADVLRQSADGTVRCPDCESTFYVTAGNCPFCPAHPAPRFIHMQVNRWDPDIDDLYGSAIGTKPVWHRMIDAEPGSVTDICRNVVTPIASGNEDPPALRIRVLRSGIEVAPLSGQALYVVHGSSFVPIMHEKTLPMPLEGKEVYLHFGAPDRPHRMAALRYYGSRP